MSVINKRLCSGILTTSRTTLYTVPTNNYTIIKTITLCNVGNTDDNITIFLNNTEILFQFIIVSHDTINIPVEQILSSNELIEGISSSGITNFYISGKEVS